MGLTIAKSSLSWILYLILAEIIFLKKWVIKCYLYKILEFKITRLEITWSKMR